MPQHAVAEAAARPFSRLAAGTLAQRLLDEGKSHLQSGRHVDAAASFSLAISMGNSLALAHLSWLLLFGGAGVSPDHTRAHELLRSRKHFSCCHCQGCLSCCFAEGWGVPKNIKRAAQLAERSASAGSVFGLYMMGWLHECDSGAFPVNRPLALAFYEQAADMGLAAAQNNAGFMCAASILHAVLRCSLIPTPAGISMAMECRRTTAKPFTSTNLRQRKVTATRSTISRACSKPALALPATLTWRCECITLQQSTATAAL